jgi:UDP:flavonoid glycosyltransferase YjiC (YdhE family)
MASIVFAWELGTASGHICQLLPAARILAARGHQVTLVLRELHGLRPEECAGMRLLQAPLWQLQVQGLPKPPLSYAEILLRFGYHDADMLQGLVAGWVGTLELARADLVVASHAPTALLAARALGVPAMTLGSGFYVPPRVIPVPNMRPWMQVSPQRLVSSDHAAAQTASRVLGRYGASALGGLAELFDVKANLFCTFPELDHYQPRLVEMQRGRYLGTLFELRRGVTVTWPRTPGRRVLVYLRPEVRDFERVMQVLGGMDCAVLASVPGIAERQRAALETPRCRILCHPLRLEKLRDTCDLAISYGGHGFVSAMLMGGVPLLLLPVHLEQFLTAHNVQAIGAGRMVNPEQPPPDYAVLLPAMLEDARLKRAARDFAAKYAQFDQRRQQEIIVDAMEQVLNT